MSETLCTSPFERVKSWERKHKTLFKECHKANFSCQITEIWRVQTKIFLQCMLQINLTEKWGFFKRFNCKCHSLLALFLSPKQLSCFSLQFPQNSELFSVFVFFLCCTLEKFFGCCCDQQRSPDSSKTTNNQPLCNSNFLSSLLPKTNGWAPTGNGNSTPACNGFCKVW